MKVDLKLEWLRKLITKFYGIKLLQFSRMLRVKAQCQHSLLCKGMLCFYSQMFKKVWKIFRWTHRGRYRKRFCNNSTKTRKY